MKKTTLGSRREKGLEGLEATSFYIGRVYYNYISVLELYLAKHGLDKHLKPGMGHVLFALFAQDDCNFTEIREQIGVSASAMTKMVRRMESAGIVTRNRDPNDGRAWRVKLTRLGRSLEKKCHVLSAEMNAGIERGINRRDLVTAKKILAQMNENMLIEKS